MTKKGRRETGFFKGVRAEMRKVTWPNKKELASYTGVTILISAIVAVVVYGLDLIIHWLLAFIM